MAETASGALALYSSMGQNPTAALSFIDTMGKAFHQGGLAGCKSEGQGKAMALTCMCEGLTPMQLMRTYHFIDGKPSMRADAMLAEFEGIGGVATWLDQGDDGKQAVLHVNYRHHDMDVRYTIEDAQRAKLVKNDSGWVKDPGAMLRARVVSKAIRMVAPSIVAGCYTPEELEDAEVIDVVATPIQPAAAERKPRGKKQDIATAINETAIETTGKPVEQLNAEAEAGGSQTYPSAETLEEIQKIVGENDLTANATAWMTGRNVSHVKNLTASQGRRLLVFCYVEALQFHERLRAILDSKSIKTIDDADEDLITAMLDSLREKYLAK